MFAEFLKRGARAPPQNGNGFSGFLMSKNVANAVAILSSESRSIVYEKKFDLVIFLRRLRGQKFFFLRYR